VPLSKLFHIFSTLYLKKFDLKLKKMKKVKKAPYMAEVESWCSIHIIEITIIIAVYMPREILVYSFTLS